MRRKLKVCFTVSIDVSEKSPCGLPEKLRNLELNQKMTNQLFVESRRLLAAFLECKEITDTDNYPALLYYKGVTQDCAADDLCYRGVTEDCDPNY